MGRNRPFSHGLVRLLGNLIYIRDLQELPLLDGPQGGSPTMRGLRQAVQSKPVARLQRWPATKPDLQAADPRRLEGHNDIDSVRLLRIVPPCITFASVSILPKYCQ